MRITGYVGEIGQHQHDDLALPGPSLVSGETVSPSERRRIVQLALALECIDRPLDFADGGRAGAVGEGGRKQVGLRERRVALRQMGQRPVDGLARGMDLCCELEDIRLSRRSGRTVLAGFSDAIASLAAPVEAPLHRRGDQHLRVEAEIGNLPGPGLAQHLPVDVAFGGARHQRRAPGQMLVLRRAAKTPALHCRLGLRAPCRKRFYDVSGDARDLEPPIGVGLLYGVAELLEFPGKLAPVERAQQHFRGVQPFVRHLPSAPSSMLAITE